MIKKEQSPNASVTRLKELKDERERKLHEFSQRLKKVIAMLEITGRNYAELAGIGYSTVHNYLHAQSFPTLDNLVLLAKAGNVSVEWLATGVDAGLENNVTGVVTVPFIDQPSRHLKLDAQLLSTCDHGSLYALKVDTDAMHPTFYPGTVLLIDANDKKLTDSKIVVLLQNGNYLYKRVQILLDGIGLLNDNNSYPSIEVSFDDIDSINVVGTVILVINGAN